MSLAACRLFCTNHGGLWPKPTGRVQLGNVLVHIDPSRIEMRETYKNVKTSRNTDNDKDKENVSTPITHLVRGASNLFTERLNAAVDDGNRTKKLKKTSTTTKRRSSNGLPLIVNLIIDDDETRQLKLFTDESYKLTVRQSDDDRLYADIEATTFYGGRHGLETLGQLIVYDDIRDELQLPRDVTITDEPHYTHRGILLDTGRNYVNVDVIKRTIDGMSASKLNVFHWHLTDSQSFPYYSKRRPELSRLGAYRTSHVYTIDDVKEIVDYGNVRGVKIVPEFDAPAHVGEGWQDTDFVVCFNKHPWQQYCVEPPCGQFDPTKEKLYDYLEG